MITTGGAQEKTYKLGNKNLFQLYTGSSQYLAGALQALKEKNPKPHIAFVYEDDPFTKAVVGAVRGFAKKQGDVDCRSTSPMPAPPPTSRRSSTR